MRIVRNITIAVATTLGALAGPLVGMANAQASAPCGSSAAACVDLSTDQAWLMDGGAVTYGPVPITSGKPGHETPTGVFSVDYKDRDHLSREFDNAPMPYSVFFTPGIAFHEGSLNAQSHGCIHLSHKAAKTFFADLQPGEVVQVVP